MSLAAGTRLEHYEILEALGAGGMGEVYRAVDTKLRREVAIKVLPPAFANDASRLARFEREAHLLAALNHPHIAAIYGLEHSNGIHFLVLELVEGPTLGERLKAGPLAVPEALRIASQIAEAFEAAHEKGVIHRDLKPANVKLTSGGNVKVLDFGLAKAIGEPEPASGASAAPTMTMQETAAGIVLGTAAYMSPEQAEGKPTDKRSDVWSFGVVLYEMLSGKQCFEGKTLSHVLVHVLEQEPEWEKLPESVPASVSDLLKRCLQKDPSRRLRDIGDVRLLLQASAEQAASVPRVHSVAETKTPRGQQPRLWQAIAAALFLIAAGLAVLYFRPKPSPPADITRFEIAEPANFNFTGSLAVSPDGRKLAFIGSSGGRQQLFVRSLDAVQLSALAGTEGAGGTPFWSPDSRYIVFSQGTKLDKIEATGGPVQTLCAVAGAVLGGFWTADGKVVYGVNGLVPLMEVSSSGGSPTPVTKTASGEARHGFPVLLPDGKHFVYQRATSPTAGGIYLGSLDAKPEDQASKRLLNDASAVSFIATGADRGYLLFVRMGTLMAQPFDTKRLELAGEAIPIAEQLGALSAQGNFSTSATGVLVYRTGGGAEQQLTWFDRQGKSSGAAGEPFLSPGASAPAISPDGKRVAFARTDAQSGNSDIWLLDFARGSNTRFTFDPGADQNPVWSPDGSKIAFLGQRGNKWGIYQKASNLLGEEELLYDSGGAATPPTGWSRDGRFLLFQMGGAGVMALPIENREHKPIPLLTTEFSQRGPRFSPDGKLFSYLSAETGADEVYIRTFDPSGAPAQQASGGKWMVSKGGGGGAHWRADGKEIFYFTGGTMMSVEVTPGPSFGVPKPLFKAQSNSILLWDVTGDGQRFLIAVPAGVTAGTPYTVIMNWPSLIEKR